MIAPMLIALAAAAAPAATEPQPSLAARWHQIVTAAHAMQISSHGLDRALRDPAAAPASQPRYCFTEARIVDGSAQTICRSRDDWNRYGLEPIGQ